MRPVISIICLLFLSSCLGFTDVKKKPENIEVLSSSSIYDLLFEDIEGREVSMAAFKGKKILIVNTASNCGFTSQYKELQRFHEQYGDKVVVLGFPSNDFGGQEPGNEVQIKDFCEKNYGVSFLLSKKVSVKGNDKHPIYQFLTELQKNGWNDKGPNWNFCKYLINEEGRLVGFYGSSVGPYSNNILQEIRK